MNHILPQHPLPSNHQLKSLAVSHSYYGMLRSGVNKYVLYLPLEHPTLAFCNSEIQKGHHISKKVFLSGIEIKCVKVKTKGRGAPPLMCHQVGAEQKSKA